ncbi:MAG: bifunctional diguanylate cyclase/phosphodiesterase [Kangiellaceae bacterium]|jgi:diguanylate cyclase (GGDEF)-like protein|nr:bifunctional diguanylate cyclase/phosphodiesterase [Kangiellaceae bacterium]
MDLLTSPKFYANTIFITGVVALAIIFFAFSRRLHIPTIKYLGYSLFSIATHNVFYNAPYFSNLTGYKFHFTLPFSFLAQFFLYLHIIYLFAGISLLSNRRLLHGNHIKSLVIIAITLSCISVLPYANSLADDARIYRYILRVTLPITLTGLMLIGLATWILLNNKNSKGIGATTTSYILLVFGSLKIAVAVLSFLFLSEAWIRSLAQSYDYLDLLGTLLIGIGLVVWLVENEFKKYQGAQTKIDFLRFNDQLTGLANRKSYLSRLEQALASKRYVEFKTMVVLLGIDNFKNINDHRNITSGDQVLISISNRLQSACPTASCIARVGGDVFALMFERITSDETVTLLVEKVLSAISKPFVAMDNSQFPVHCSVGVALSPEHGVVAEQVLKSAEYALYHSKSQGGNCVTNYQTWMTEGREKDSALENDLLSAFSDDQFVLNYQPLINLESDEVVGFEVLVRWNHPGQGLLSPSVFLPLLERAGLMPRLDKLIIQKSLETIQQWREFSKGIFLAINLSPVQFQDENFAEYLSQQLIKHKIDPSLLQLEITEHSAMSDVDLGINVLSSLKEKNIIVAMDDFGTGYSSMSYLRQLPVDKIKIDRSFIQAIEEDPSAASIVKAIASLAIGLGKKVVAEGIETDEQMSFVKQLNIHEAQGFGLYRPLSYDDAKQLLV